MVATVMGIFKKPYKLDNGVSGVACRVSFHVGEYRADPTNGEYAEGDQFIEVKCPQKIADRLQVNEEYYIDLDDGKSKMKSAMIRSGDGFIPLDV